MHSPVRPNRYPRRQYRAMGNRKYIVHFIYAARVNGYDLVFDKITSGFYCFHELFRLLEDIAPLFGRHPIAPGRIGFWDDGLRYSNND